ncbi:unnamed protein product [Auanema sp. JU1783]|nr:unnamed protein product [Auanema sp. JU1783]
MSGSANIDSDLSDFGGVIIPNYPDDEEPIELEIEPSVVVDDLEYLRRTFKMCPKFAEDEKVPDAVIYPEEIQGHVLGALMASSAYIDDAGVSAALIDQNLADITNRFITLKRIGAVLNESDAAKKNIELVLRNPIFRGVIEEVNTSDGNRYRPVENSCIGGLLSELKRCFKKKTAEMEAKAQKKRREMELPDNKQRRMHGRNLLVNMMNLVINALSEDKVKWQTIQTFYNSIREPEHQYHTDLYLFYEKLLDLNEYPQLDAKANKHLFGKSKTTNFLALTEFNDIIEYCMTENQLYIYFKERLTEENYEKFIYSDEDIQSVQKKWEEAQAQFDDRGRDSRHFRRRRDERAQSKLKEACLPSATATYVQRLKRNMDEEDLYQSSNLDTPFGYEPPKTSHEDLSTDEDDILSEKCFSDEDEDVRKEKEEKKRKRQEAIAAKEERKQQKREQQRLLEEASANREHVPNIPGSANVLSEMEKQPEDQFTLRNKWEKTVNEDPVLAPVPKPAPVAYTQSHPTVQPLFGYNSSGNSRTPPPKAVQEKSFFGGPSDDSLSQSRSTRNTSTTNQFEQYNSSKPVNDRLTKTSSSIPSSSMRGMNDQVSSCQSPSPLYNHPVTQSFPLERLASSCSVTSTTHRSGAVEENKMKFLSFLKTHVKSFRSEESRHMRLLSNISGSCYGHPTRLFGSRYIEVIQSFIPQIQVEDVETEDGYEILFKWVEQ